MRARLVLTLGLLGLPGCTFGYLVGSFVAQMNSSYDSDWDTGWGWRDSGEPTECNSTGMLSSWPAEGSVQVYPWTTLAFEFEGPDDYRWVDIGQAWNQGLYWASYEDTGTQVLARLNGPLRGGVSYSMQVYTCEDTHEVQFTVADLGEAEVNESNLRGRTWVMDPTSSVLIDPSALSDLVHESIEPRLLLSITTDDSGDMVPLLAWEGEVPGEQDWCLPTTEWPVMSLVDNPYSTSVGDSVTWTLPLMEGDEAASVTLESPWVEGAFSEDGELWVGEMSAIVDLRGLVGLLGTDADEVCAVMASVGVSCEPCADSELYCVPFRQVGMVADELSGAAPLERVLSTNCDERCPESVDNPDCP